MARQRRKRRQRSRQHRKRGAPSSAGQPETQVQRQKRCQDRLAQGNHAKNQAGGERVAGRPQQAVADHLDRQQRHRQQPRPHIGGQGAQRLGGDPQSLVDRPVQQPQQQAGTDGDRQGEDQGMLDEPPDRFVFAGAKHPSGCRRRADRQPQRDRRQGEGEGETEADGRLRRDAQTARHPGIDQGRDHDGQHAAHGRHGQTQQRLADRPLEQGGAMGLTTLFRHV